MNTYHHEMNKISITTYFEPLDPPFTDVGGICIQGNPTLHRGASATWRQESKLVDSAMAESINCILDNLVV